MGVLDFAFFMFDVTVWNVMLYKNNRGYNNLYYFTRRSIWVGESDLGENIMQSGRSHRDRPDNVVC